MKKNILGALVIIFVLFACLLVFNELSHPNTSEVDTQQYYVDSE